MRFTDQLKDDQLREYEVVLAKLARFVEDCAGLVGDASDAAQRRTFPEHKYHHATVYLLMRHVVEATDGVGILVSKGSADNCGLGLRSAFEGLASILYILKADTERRALAYQVGHAHRKIRFYRKFIPGDPEGRRIRDELRDDPHVSIFDRPGVNWQGMIGNLSGMLKKPEYAPIQAEWERLAGGRRGHKSPHWYSLFGGPGDLRTLSVQVGKGAYYEILYRHWSDFAHAGGAFDRVSEGRGDGISVTPVRCPEGIEQACSFACQTCVETVMSVLRAFAPEAWPGFRQRIAT